MTLPSLPAQGNTSWYTHYAALDARVRGGAAVPVTAFGVGTGRTPAQNDAAFASAVASGEPLVVPAASAAYRISAPIDLRGRQAASLVGANVEGCIIEQQTNNVPIVRMGGGLMIRYQQLTDLRLQYATEQPTTATGANAVELDRAYFARLDRLNIYRAARGIHTPPSAEPDATVRAYAFQCHLSNLQISDYSHTAISFVTTENASSTGNVVDNVYTIALGDDGVERTVERALHYYGHDATIVRNFNVERAKFAQEAVLFNAVKNAVVDSLHFEVATTVGYGMGFLSVYGASRATVRGMDVHRCHFDAAASTAPVFKIGGGADLDAYGVHTWGSTRGDIVVPLFFTYDQAGGSIRLRGWQDTGNVVTVEQSGFPAARVPSVKQINDSVRHWQEGAADVVLGTAAPTTGTWARGSRVINTAPAAGGAQGWVCVTAGTPGTWRAMPNLSAT